MDKLIKRVGVVNWDCSLPASTYFGGYATRSLGPNMFRDRTPYYAKLLGKDQIDYPERTVAEYEIEMRYAIDAGIDYFAYCWYDRKPHQDHVLSGEAATVDGCVCELASARMKHLQSPLREKLKLCAILITCHPYFDEELIELAETMKQPYYEKVDGRPLVYLFASPWEQLTERLLGFCRKAGTPEPYVVLMADGKAAGTPDIVQALSAYAFTAQRDNWDDFMAAEIAKNEARSASGLPIVPHFAMGWNPMPRVMHPVPWTKYAEGVPYTPVVTEAQLLAGAALLKSWIKDHQESCPTGHVFVFAWNEFEEGGWICPTIGDNGAPDDTLCKAVAKVTQLWKA